MIARRVVATVVLALVAFAGLGTIAERAGAHHCDPGQRWCFHSSTGGLVPGAPASPVASALFWRATVSQTPEGEPCWTIAPVPGATSGMTYAEALAYIQQFDQNGTLYDLCPAPVPTPAELAQAFWHDGVGPPSPEPLWVAPGRAVTGLRAYLEIGGDGSPQWTVTNPFGPDIMVEGIPRYVVDWGDTTGTIETDSRGVAWPGGPGEITHVFTRRGTVTVTVTAYWRGRWSAGGESGPLPELPTPTVATLTLPIDEVQAVINR